jgi:hypothetical protein
MLERLPIISLHFIMYCISGSAGEFKKRMWVKSEDSAILLGCSEMREEANGWTVFGSMKRTGIRQCTSTLSGEQVSRLRYFVA